jgi:two-component system, LuxR family, sensor kinase FixL
LCQELTGILLNEKVLQKRLEALSLPEAEQAKKIADLIHETVSHSRAFSKSLYPVEIEEQGLIHALRDFSDTVEEIYGVTCSAVIDEDIAVGDHIVASHLFRITQEAVSNAVRHGRASTILIALHRGSGNRTKLSVADNGLGIKPPASRAAGMGLKIMAYRAKVIGGTLEISARQIGGTQVVCTFPHGKG